MSDSDNINRATQAAAETGEAQVVISDGEYRMAMDALCSVFGVISQIPVEAMLQTVLRAETIGPVLYPSEWMRSSLPQQRQILEAAQHVQRVVREVGTPPR